MAYYLNNIGHLKQGIQKIAYSLNN